MAAIKRADLLAKFNDMVARRQPIIGGGAGTGLSAKCEEAGGIDLIVIYNSGRYRMAGRGSLGRALGLRQRQRHREGDGARGPAGRASTRPCSRASTAPTRSSSCRCSWGAEGARLLGRPELPDRRDHRRHVPGEPGRDRHQLRLEVDMIRQAHELDLLTTPYVFNATRRSR